MSKSSGEGTQSRLEVCRTIHTPRFSSDCILVYLMHEKEGPIEFCRVVIGNDEQRARQKAELIARSINVCTQLANTLEDKVSSGKEHSAEAGILYDWTGKEPDGSPEFPDNFDKWHEGVPTEQGRFYVVLNRNPYAIPLLCSVRGLLIIDEQYKEVDRSQITHYKPYCIPMPTFADLGLDSRGKTDPCPDCPPQGCNNARPCEDPPERSL